MSKNSVEAVAVLSEQSNFVPVFGKITSVTADGIGIIKGRSGSSKGNATFIPMSLIQGYQKGGGHKRFADVVYAKGQHTISVQGILGDTDKNGFTEVTTEKGKAYFRSATITAKEAIDMPDGEAKVKKVKKKKKAA